LVINNFYLNGGSVRKNNKICICVQGIGFVGAAMISVLSSIKDKKSNDYMYNIIGIDKDTSQGKERININNQERVIDLIMKWKGREITFN